LKDKQNTRGKKIIYVKKRRGSPLFGREERTNSNGIEVSEKKEKRGDEWEGATTLDIASLTIVEGERTF